MGLLGRSRRGGGQAKQAKQPKQPKQPKQQQRSGGGLFARLFGRRRPAPETSASARRRSGNYDRDRDGRMSPATPAPGASPLYAQLATRGAEATPTTAATTPLAAQFATQLPVRMSSTTEAPPSLPPKQAGTPQAQSAAATAAGAAAGMSGSATPASHSATHTPTRPPLSSSAATATGASLVDSASDRSVRVASPPPPRPASAADTLNMTRPLSFSPEMFDEQPFSPALELPALDQDDHSLQEQQQKRSASLPPDETPSLEDPQSPPITPQAVQTAQPVLQTVPSAGAPILRSAAGSIKAGMRAPAVTRHSVVPSRGGKHGSTAAEMLDWTNGGALDAPPVPSFNAENFLSANANRLSSTAYTESSEASFDSAPKYHAETSTVTSSDLVASPATVSPGSALPLTIPAAAALPTTETVSVSSQPAAAASPSPTIDTDIAGSAALALSLSFDNSPISPIAATPPHAEAEAQDAVADGSSREAASEEATMEAAPVEEASEEDALVEVAAVAATAEETPIPVISKTSPLASPTSMSSLGSRLQPPGISVGSYNDFDANASVSDLLPSPISPGDTPIVTPEFKANTALPVKPELPPKDSPAVPPKDALPVSPPIVNPPARSHSVKTPARGDSLRRAQRDTSTDAKLPPVSGKFASLGGKGLPPSTGSSYNTPQRARSLTPRRAVTSTNSPPSPKSPGEETPTLDDFMGLMKTVVSRNKGMSIRDAARTAEKLREFSEQENAKKAAAEV